MEKLISLGTLNPGETGIVVKINTTDKLKRRFLDLGIVPNTKIKILYESPFKEPKAYLIRGAVIALREEDAEMIKVTRMEESLWD